MIGLLIILAVVLWAAIVWIENKQLHDDPFSLANPPPRPRFPR